MPKRISLLCLFCSYFTWLSGQGAVAVRRYVFELFSKVSVQEQNGSMDQDMLHCNVFTRENVSAASSGQFMALTVPEKADTVFIPGGKFIPVDNELYELHTATKYTLLVQCACTVKKPGWVF